MVKGEILFDKEVFGEGSYQLKVFKKGNIVRYKAFGYYDGGSLNRGFKITIETDTIIIISY